jgi:hypothetical protein
MCPLAAVAFFAGVLLTICAVWAHAMCSSLSFGERISVLHLKTEDHPGEARVSIAVIADMLKFFGYGIVKLPKHMTRNEALRKANGNEALLDSLVALGLIKLDPEPLTPKPITPSEALQMAMGQGGAWPHESHEDYTVRIIETLARWGYQIVKVEVRRAV